MIRNLNYISVSSNEEISLAAANNISSLLQKLTVKSIKQDLSDFESTAEFLLTDRADYFCWDIAGVPEVLDEKLDYFLIPNLETAIVFKADDHFLKAVRSFYCPPVAFIGGGPGNHEWLTIEAKYLLDRCDIIFYDALVNPLIVASLPEHIERFYVGKRGDSKSFDQKKLNQLICDHARNGYKVGRLKGGDPGILGRITEEIDALLKLGLSFTISPGISAMQAVSASGIHLTQRGVCDRVTLTTARSAGGEINNLLPFKDASLIVYMGILSTEKIMTQLLEAGYKEDLPTAILVNLTRPGEQVFHTTLSELANTIEKHSIRPPGLLVFGETARKDLHRVSPLSPVIGRRILLTENSKEALKASTRLRRWGAKPVFLYKELINVEGETIIPEFDDIIFFTPQEVSDFYEIIGGPRINGECNIVSLGKETDATFSCLFRRNSIIAGDYKEAVDFLRQHILMRVIK